MGGNAANTPQGAAACSLIAPFSAGRKFPGGGVKFRSCAGRSGSFRDPRNSATISPAGPVVSFLDALYGDVRRLEPRNRLTDRQAVLRHRSPRLATLVAADPLRSRPAGSHPERRGAHDRARGGRGASCVSDCARTGTRRCPRSPPAARKRPRDCVPIARTYGALGRSPPERSAGPATRRACRRRRS